MKLFTLRQLAQVLGVDEKTARKFAAELHGVRIGKRLRYTEASVLALIERGGCSSERSAA
jgi:hypothetical protein